MLNANEVADVGYNPLPTTLDDLSEDTNTETVVGTCIDDLFVEYDLENFMEFENNLWSKEIKFLHDVMIMIDDDIDLIFVNSRPVDVTNAGGINCVGCFLDELAFFVDNNFLTLVLSFCPGGIYEVAVIAIAFDLDPDFVAFHHIIRLLFILFTVPVFLRVLEKIKK